MTEKAAKKAQGYLEKRLETLKGENLALKKKMGLLREEHKALKKAVKNSGLMIDAVTAGLVLVQEGKIIDANRAALDLFGYSAQEVIGLDFTALIPPSPATQVANLHRKKLAGNPVPDKVEAKVLSKNGALIRCDISANKIRLNGRNAFLVNILGIEERKLREEELIQTGKMEALVNMAEGVTRTFGPGIRALSKDLRRLKEAGQSANKAFLDEIDHLDRAAQQIAETAGRLERFSRTKPDLSRVKLFDLKETVKEAVAFMGPRLKDAEKTGGIKIALKTYLRSVSPVKGDPNEIREMVIEVIQNAVDAMPQGGNLYITIEENADQAHIYIQDSGQGISEQEADKILNPFFTTRRNERKGLGLSLSYAILKRHQGDIEITGKGGEGATVAIRLPIERKVQKMKTGPVRKKMKRARIMIIVDEDMLRGLLSQILRNKGYRTDTAGSGREGIEKLGKKKYHMVIAGLKVLGIKFDLFKKRIKKIDPDLVIALIAEERHGQRVDAFEKGEADMIISKPIDMKRLVNRIPEILMQRFSEP